MFLTTTVIAFLSLGITHASPLTEATKRGTSINWSPCDLDFPKTIQDAIVVPIDCATIQVPLDYTDPDCDMLDLQLIKVNATNQPAKGSVIFNPGGPGSSGVEEIATKGFTYEQILGGNHNIIGFDPRGTGRSIPFKCNITTVFDNSSNIVARSPYGVIPQGDGYDTLTSRAWEGGKAVVEGCQVQNATGRLIGTAFVARDLLAIVDALGEDGLLNFWGRSYSTVIGQTFAAMFPDRVGRVLLDSVFLAEDYHSGRFLGPTRDVEFSLSHFFDECIKAGPEFCLPANFTGNSTTSRGLLEEVADVFQDLIDDPVMLPDSFPVRYWWRPGNHTLYQHAKFAIMNSFFVPEGFFAAGKILNDVLNRDWPELIRYLTSREQPPADEEAWNQGIHGFHGIACSDGKFRADSPDGLYSLIQAQAAQSSFADAFSPQSWVCAQWKYDAAERYTGSWDNITTKNPILLVNGRYDPITPLSGAWDASARFPGSILLVHEGVGHGVLNHPSNCTTNAIANYFVNGTLPKQGTKCKPNEEAFVHAVKVMEALENAEGGESGDSTGQ